MPLLPSSSTAPASVATAAACSVATPRCCRRMVKREADAEEAGDLIVALERLDQHVPAIGDQISGDAFDQHEKGAGPGFSDGRAGYVAGAGRECCGNGAEANRHVGSGGGSGSGIERQGDGRAHPQAVGSVFSHRPA